MVMIQPGTITKGRSLSAPPQLGTGVLVSTGVTAVGFTIIGAVLLVMGVFTPGGVGRHIVEIGLSAAVLFAAGLLFRTVVDKKGAPRGVGLLSGEVELAATFLYLGVAFPAALGQFIAVLAGFVLGAGELALSGASKSARPAGKVTFPAVVRGGVILIVGTILLAIALGQLPGAALKPPQWSWISFLGITIPGMLLLVAREGVKEGLENWGQQSRFRGVLSLLATELLLIVGLTIMLYGSYSNLTLGKNGYLVGAKGNAAGLMLWAGAALFLILVRGPFKWVLSTETRRVYHRILSMLLYGAAVVAFIYGERSVLTGKDPLLAVGGAAPAALLIVLGAVLVLVVGRAAAQKVSVGGGQQKQTHLQEKRTMHAETAEHA
jgi:hypothetical protein